MAIAGAACTSNKPSVTGGGAVSLGSATAVTTFDDSTAPGTDTATTSAAPGTAATTSAAPHSSGANPLPKDTCTIAQLTVRMIRGGADTGREIGLVTFTNSSKVACSMFGYPGVSLRLGGALLAAPAKRDTKAPATVHLAPGAQAQAQFTDFSSCQAPLSDAVRIYPPNLTAYVDRPGEFRGCSLVVEPVTPS